MKHLKKIIFIALLLMNLSIFGQDFFSEQIFYKTNEYLLSDNQKETIDNLLLKAEKTDDILIEISSNADSIGTEQYNSELSKMRANELYEYFLKKNINKDVISIINNGEKYQTNFKSLKQNRRVDIKITFIEVNKNETVFEEVYELDNFYNNVSVNEQKFIIRNNKDTVIIGESGTILFFPANSLNASSDSNIEITLKEILSTSDMILENLTTLSSNKQLETAGMIYVEAKQNGKIIDIDKSNPVLLMLPTDDIKDNMQLFSGEHDDDGNLNWETNGRSYSTTIYSSMFYTENLNRFKKFIMRVFHRDLYLYLLNSEMQMRDFEEKYKNINTENLKRVPQENMNYYVFNFSNSGWINCDRFINENPENLTTLLIDEPVNINTEIKIVYKDIKSIIPVDITEKGYILNNALLNKEIWIIALKYKKNIPYLALEEGIISNNSNFKLNFKPYYLLENLKKELERLNN